MTYRKPKAPIKKLLPVIVAGAIGITGCSGEQAGDTNAGVAGGLAGGGVSAGTVLGVVGGVALAGLLLDSDDSDSAGGTANGGTTDVGTDGGTTNGGTTDGGTTNGGTTDGGTTDGGTTDGGTTDGGTTDGGTTDGGTTDGGTTDGGTTDGGTTDGGTTDGGNTDGGTTDNGSAVISDTGVVNADLTQNEAVPASGSSGIGTANLAFNRSTGDASGSVTLTGIDADRVDIMVGPPGTNGFVAVALEMTGANQWSVPATLSAEQQAFVLQNLNSGNLYVAARTAAFPDGEVRRQLTPAGVTQYTTSVGGINGASGNADGYLLVNETTGDYSITWNTSDATLASAHVNDGVVSDSTENNYAPLTQRTSNPSRFFLDGNFNDPADPLYPDLLARLAAGTVWLDAHSADDTRVFFGQLQ
jgi:hypothetical protein